MAEPCPHVHLNGVRAGPFLLEQDLVVYRRVAEAAAAGARAAQVTASRGENGNNTAARGGGRDYFLS